MGELILYEKPNLPDEWNYDESVNKLKPVIYKWKNLSQEMIEELWIAREKLSSQGIRTDLTSAQKCRSWAQYCDDIGVAKWTANRWLKTWYDKPRIAEQHNTGSSDNQESYTPQKYIDSVYAVMGEIDIDPASNDIANKTVDAKTYYTKETNGLDKPWYGNVFLNPPYNQPDIKYFINKLIEEYNLGNTLQAILLTNDNTDTTWFQDALKTSSCVCLHSGRINFYKPNNTTTSPTNGQSFFYFGKNIQGFFNEFSKHGIVLTKFK